MGSTFVDKRTLHTVFFPPFKACVMEAEAMSCQDESNYVECSEIVDEFVENEGNILPLDKSKIKNWRLLDPMATNVFWVGIWI